MGSVTEIIATAKEIFTFFISLFVDLFTTIVSTPIIYFPLAIGVLFMLVWKVPPMIKKLRKN